jgi:hypothetical protein
MLLHANAHRDEWQKHEEFWLENVKGKDYLEDLGADGGIILELILKR